MPFILYLSFCQMQISTHLLSIIWPLSFLVCVSCPFSYPVFQLLQSPSCNTLLGIPVVTTNSEGPLGGSPYSLGDGSSREVRVVQCVRTQDDFTFFCKHYYTTWLFFKHKPCFWSILFFSFYFKVILKKQGKHLKSVQLLQLPCYVSHCTYSLAVDLVKASQGLTSKVIPHLLKKGRSGVHASLSLLTVDCFGKGIVETNTDPPIEHQLCLPDPPIGLCPKPSDHSDDEQQGVKFISRTACFLTDKLYGLNMLKRQVFVSFAKFNQIIFVQVCLDK